jgi:hypothetical protein
MQFLAALAIAAATATSAAARQITVYNNCPFTIWYVYIQRYLSSF